MKQVCILTTFSGYDPSYSLIGVAASQIKMLLLGGYKPVVIVQEGFKPEAAFALPDVTLEFVPKVTVSNEGILPENYEEEVEMLAAKYQEIFEKHKIDVVISHDLISQPACLVPNLAGRKVTKNLPKLRWLHWVHSVFSSNVESNILHASQQGRARWPNSYLVFPNAYDRQRVARNFHVEEDEVLHVPHPIDIEEFFDFHPKLGQLFRERNLFDKEVIIVYPCRLDRGKQPHLIIHVIEALKKMGTHATFICADFSSTGGDKVKYRDEMKDLAEAKGLDETDVIFLSEVDKEFELHAPRKVMMNLFSMSNVFVLPSRSETYSLVAQEAALAGNFLILNHDFPVMRSIYGDEPKYFRFSANIGLDGYDGVTDVEYGSPRKYFEDIARYINWQVRNNRVLQMKTRTRQTRSLQAVMRTYLDPIIHAD